jgi:hypothetical protein
MNIIRALSIITAAGLLAGGGRAAERDIPRFSFEPSEIALHRLAQPNSYFDKVGRKFAILGFESGSFEAWAYPLKLFRNFEFSFLIGSSTQPILGKDIVRAVDVTPAATTLTYAFQSFTIAATFVAAIDEPGAVILLAVDTTEPLTVVCSFLPVLQPMWPAGLGGQYASWDDGLKAYLISEPTRSNHGFVGSPAARGISYTPAHMLSDAPNQFAVAIDRPGAVRERFLPIVFAGGKGKRDDVRKVYEKLAANPAAVYRAAAEHYRRLRTETLRIKTPLASLDTAFEWAKVSFDNLVVANPDLGQGLVAGLGTSGTGGRPGFGWFFGGDAFMNSLSLNGYGAFGTVREALEFSQKWQRDDGKMAHELSQAAGYLAWFKDYPYAYLHGDTTPFYIAACYDYLRMTGDADFVKRSWPSLKKAYDWCLTTDADGDGLMDNRKAGLGALEFGSLTGIQTDIFIAAAWARAAYAMESLAGAVGDAAYEQSSRDHFAKANNALDAKFWDAARDRYAYAFAADGKLVDELTPWAAVPLAWNLGTAERGRRTLEKINTADLTTDWGVRMLSTGSSYFEPLNYNYGAVWPFLTGWVATALFKHGFDLQGYGLVTAAVRHTFDHGLGVVTELFSGHQNIWPQEAVAHQGFSSGGLTLPVIRGLLGLEGDALAREIRFEPRPPADWTDFSIEGYKIGDEMFSFHIRRSAASIGLEVKRRTTQPWTLVFTPALGLGTRVRAATANGRHVPVRTDVIPGGQDVRAEVKTKLEGTTVCEIRFDPAVEILPPENESRTGDPNRGLRILRQDFAPGRLTVVCEGLSGESYVLGVTNAPLIKTVQGAALEKGSLRIDFPAGSSGSYGRRSVILNLK